MLNPGDKVRVVVDNSYILKYVENCYDKEIVFEGTIQKEDPVYPNSIILIPSELSKDKNFFPKIRVISKRNIIDVIKIEETESSRIDLDNIDVTVPMRKFMVNSSDKSKKYEVIYYPNDNHYTCTCYAGLMRRLCKHVKGVHKKIENENKKEAS